MKLLPWVLLGLGSVSFLYQEGGPDATLILYGDTRGYLSPCGCTSPMSGGIRRAATAVRQLSTRGNAVFALSGPLVAGPSRQDALKADAYAESARELNASAVGYTAAEASLGQGSLYSMDTLSDHKLVSSSVVPSPSHPLHTSLRGGRFLIASISSNAAPVSRSLGEQTAPTAQALGELVAGAQTQDLVPVALFDGDEAAARKLARRYPALGVITYSSSETPREPAVEGQTWLVSTGYHGKFVVAIGFRGNKPVRFQPVALGPDVKDDPRVSSIYRQYLHLVDSEKLLAQVPRTTSGAFAGAEACRSCHQVAYKVWAGSAHAHALSTLERQGHGTDPECVTCHVVGLHSTRGFTGRQATPRLANVGCESCHGPALAHSRSPRRFVLPKVGAKTCISCHTVDNSPEFSYGPYWRKIAH